MDQSPEAVNVQLANLYKQQAREAEANARQMELENKAFLDNYVYESAIGRGSRNLVFNSEVDASSVLWFIQEYRAMTHPSVSGCYEPISLTINSPGGNIIDGIMMFDEIYHGRTPVHITVRGQACSMAAVLLQAGTTRKMGEHSTLMLHRASSPSGGSVDEIQDDLVEIKRLDSLMMEILAARSGTPVSALRKLTSRRKDVYLDAHEALRLGLIDCIG